MEMSIVRNVTQLWAEITLRINLQRYIEKDENPKENSIKVLQIRPKNLVRQYLAEETANFANTSERTKQTKTNGT
jgi:hypothetical protein